VLTIQNQGTALAFDEIEKDRLAARDKLTNITIRLQGLSQEAVKLFHDETEDILAEAAQLAARYVKFHSSLTQVQQKIELVIKDCSDASIEVRKIEATAASGAQLSHSPDQSNPDTRRPRTRASQQKET
jgi:hypothetical protein